MIFAFPTSSVSSCAMGTSWSTGLVSGGKVLDLGNGSMVPTSMLCTSNLLENKTMAWAELRLGLDAGGTSRYRSDEVGAIKHYFPWLCQSIQTQPMPLWDAEADGGLGASLDESHGFKNMKIEEQRVWVLNGDFAGEVGPCSCSTVNLPGNGNLSHPSCVP